MSEGSIEQGEIVRIAARGDGITASGHAVALAAPGDRIGEDGVLIAGPHQQNRVTAPPPRRRDRPHGRTRQDMTAFAEYPVLPRPRDQRELTFLGSRQRLLMPGALSSGEFSDASSRSATPLATAHLPTGRRSSPSPPSTTSTSSALAWTSPTTLWPGSTSQPGHRVGWRSVHALCIMNA